METTINYKGIPLIVHGTYEAEEEAVRYYSDGSGYPGSASSFDVNEIYVEDSEIDIFEFFSCANLDEISELVINKIEER